MKKISKFNLLSNIALFFALGLTINAQASMFDWTDGNVNVVRDASSFSLNVNGISATAQAYVVEWNGSSYDIFGAFPTGTAFTTANADGFLRNAEGLMLEEGSIGGITLSGRETCPGGGCGFDNGFYNIGQNVEKFNFALITFDQIVDLETVINSRQSNFDHDFWLASSNSAPDLSLDFVSAFSGFATSVHNPLPAFQGATGLSNSHNNLQYLAIGAPLSTDIGVFPELGNPDAQRDTFAITSFTVQPAVIPIPAASILFGSAVFALFGFIKRKPN